MTSSPRPTLHSDGHAPYRALPRWQKVDMDLLDVREGLSVLDLGCGPGYLLRKAAERASVALGVDVDEDRLRAARGGPPDSGSQAAVERAVADGHRLPFADASFDRAICTETLEHVADPDLTLRELARVLRPGGRLAVSVPHFLCEAILCRLIGGYLEFPGGHRRIYTSETLRRALLGAGLRPYAWFVRDSLEAVYWVLLSALSRPPRRFDALLAPLERWRARSRARPYSRFYHAVDQVGNRVLPKSVVVYALKPPDGNSPGVTASGPDGLATL
jgi:SAM-dependent methyltransferase